MFLGAYFEPQDSLRRIILAKITMIVVVLSLEDPLQHALTVEREAKVIENLESTAYGMILDSHQGFHNHEQHQSIYLCTGFLSTKHLLVREGHYRYSDPKGKIERFMNSFYVRPIPLSR
ncbi:unnamed protein product [Brassica oleracea var. botrytis]